LARRRPGKRRHNPHARCIHAQDPSGATAFRLKAVAFGNRSGKLETAANGKAVSGTTLHKRARAMATRESSVKVGGESTPSLDLVEDGVASVREAMDFLSCSRNSLYRLMDKG